MKLDLVGLMNGKRTYPNWSTGARYRIQCEELDRGNIKIFYDISRTPMKKRISGNFPKIINVDASFSWVLGFLKGEGTNSKKRSSYRRFIFTNKNPIFIKKVPNELHNRKMINVRELIKGCIHIIHSSGSIKKVLGYWSGKLKLSNDKFKILDYKKSLKKSKFGVCHVYLSDVILRRVIDEINNKIMK